MALVAFVLDLARSYFPVGLKLVFHWIIFIYRQLPVLVPLIAGMYSVLQAAVDYYALVGFCAPAPGAMILLLWLHLEALLRHYVRGPDSQRLTAIFPKIPMLLPLLSILFEESWSFYLLTFPPHRLFVFTSFSCHPHAPQQFPGIRIELQLIDAAKTNCQASPSVLNSTDVILGPLLSACTINMSLSTKEEGIALFTPSKAAVLSDLNVHPYAFRLSVSNPAYAVAMAYILQLNRAPCVTVIYDTIDLYT